MGILDNVTGDLIGSVKGQVGGLTDSIKAATGDITATNVAKGLLVPDYMSDMRHASNLFVANTHELQPKQGFLYHVYFDFNVAVSNPEVSKGIRATELGMLVKQVGLPKFTVDTKTYNAYNRPHITQSKIHYEPVTIQFHDDSADVVSSFWHDYYSYYYRDSKNVGTNTQEPAYYHDEVVSTRDKDWGYGPRNSLAPPYLKAIHIYSLHNKKYSEYVLINPIIKSFAHGEHNNSDTTGTMQHVMVIEYESVRYGSGKVTRKIAASKKTVDGKEVTIPGSKVMIPGFGEDHYDKKPSPITPAGGGTASMFGVGGLMDSADEASDDWSSGNYLSAALKGAKSANSLKGANLGSLLGGELTGMGKKYLNGAPNPFGTVVGGKVSQGNAPKDTQPPAAPVTPSTQHATSTGKAQGN